jgi:hypothetical protein
MRSEVWKQLDAITDGLLSTAINESLHWRPINLERYTVHISSHSDAGQTFDSL